MRKWVFLSPHFDDVVLSAGGLVWKLTNTGDKVEIWTICAGDPPFDQPLTDYAQMLHIFWELGEEDVPYSRSKEDAACCQVLKTGYRRYTVPDNIYRYIPGTDEAVVKVPDDNTGPLEPDEAYLIPPVTDFLRKT
jgi:LmbE family N-acetylglucosaminyl deacetylase